MLKVLTASQIKELDGYTIKQGSITSLELMERACRAFTNWYTSSFSEPHTIGVVCGTGNNGGDGMGIARMLKDQGYQVQVWVVKGTASESIDFTINLRQARDNKIEIQELVQEAGGGLFESCDVVIDALFGSGLSRPAKDMYAYAIKQMNLADATRVAVDMPSGLLADRSSTEPIVKADYTVSFQLPKLVFFLPEYQPYVGQWTLVDIGLSKDFIRNAETRFHYINQKGVRKILKRRSTFDHKGNYGHALLVAGSFGKIGAAILAARGALRAGLGLLTVHVPRNGYSILQSTVPEAMVSADSHDEHLSHLPSLDRYSTIGIGPGLGTAPDTVLAFSGILRDFARPMVIDADGLNIMAENRELLHLVPAGSILTPHPGEFKRLVGAWSNDFDRLDRQAQLAAQLNAIVIVKGAYTSIATPDGSIFFNSTGNPGMATGGSGDVLTGILTGLLSQGYDSLQAAILGTYLHGLAGDLAIPEFGMNSLIASDIVDHLPSAFLTLA